MEFSRQSKHDAEGGLVTPVSSATVADLRVQSVDDLLDRVERRFEVLLDRGTVVRKRRSCGARTDRDTWVRPEPVAVVTHGGVTDLLRTLGGDEALPDSLLHDGVPSCAIITLDGTAVVDIASQAHLQ